MVSARFVRGHAWLAEAEVGARYLWGVSTLLRETVKVGPDRAELQRRLAERDTTLLALVRRVLADPDRGPWPRLLRLAGCEYGDVVQLVQREGVEGALSALLHAGVYLTVGELKGHQPVVRGSTRFEVQLGDVVAAGQTTMIARLSGASRGAATVVPINLDFIRSRCVDDALILQARGAEAWRHAVWGVPGSTTLIRALSFAALGVPVEGWFTQVPASAGGLHPRYRWSERLTRWTARAVGVPLGSPVLTPLEAPWPLLRWLADTLRAGATPHLWASASAVVRLCRAAREAGVDIAGTQFTVSGEPVTGARLAEIQAVGARALARYGSTETNRIGEGCLAAATPGDLHFLHDLLAVVQPGPDGLTRGLAPGGLFFTTLHPRAPLELLNVSIGDQATVEERPCGCPLGALGWTTHLLNVRSTEKLTAGGLSLLDLDVVRLLEQVLPARFGGGPADFQLVDETGPGGEPRLRLLVHPRLGDLDDAAVREAFLAELAPGVGAARVLAHHWRSAAFMRVERQAPYTNAAGKVLHVHRAASAVASG